MQINIISPSIRIKKIYLTYQNQYNPHDISCHQAFENILSEYLSCYYPSEFSANLDKQCMTIDILIERGVCIPVNVLM